MRSLGRVRAFVVKEATELVHQPRLIVTMVLGPFAVLVLFGLGLSGGLPRFSAVFVAESPEVGDIVDEHADRLAGYIDYRGVIQSEEDALDRLERGTVDVVAVLPPDPLEFIRRDRRAVIDVYHDRLDPVISAAIEGAARLAADELNRQILASVVAEAQDLSRAADDVVPQVTEGLAEVRALLAAGETKPALARLRDLRSALRIVTGAGSEALTVLRAVGRASATEEAPRSPASVDPAVRALLTIGAEAPPEASLATLTIIEAVVNAIARDLDTLQEVRPEVLIRPFTAHTRAVSGAAPSPVDFYLPSVLMLLLQHLGVTFSALSLVREREVGSLELFAVSPVRPVEVLVGKCLTYLVFGAAVAAAIGLGLWNLVDVPLEGSLGALVAGFGAVLLASLGVGFLISLVSRTPGQAVQLALLTLLASFFFSGFFLPLDRMSQVASIVGSFLPVTHGIAIAQQVALRGAPLPAGDIGQLAAIAGVALLVTWVGFARSYRAR